MLEPRNLQHVLTLLWVPSLLFLLSLVFQAEVMNIVRQIVQSFQVSIESAVIIVGVLQKYVFNFWIKWSITAASLRHFLLGVRVAFELLVRSLHYFIENWHFYLAVIFLEILMNCLVQLSDGFPHARVKMVLYAIVSSRIKTNVPSGELLCNDRPFVSNLIVQSVQILLLTFGPLSAQNIRIQMIVVSKLALKGTFPGTVCLFYRASRTHLPFF